VLISRTTGCLFRSTPSTPPEPKANDRHRKPLPLVSHLIIWSAVFFRLLLSRIFAAFLIFFYVSRYRFRKPPANINVRRTHNIGLHIRVHITFISRLIKAGQSQSRLKQDQTCTPPRRSAIKASGSYLRAIAISEMPGFQTSATAQSRRVSNSTSVIKSSSSPSGSDLHADLSAEPDPRARLYSVP